MLSGYKWYRRLLGGVWYRNRYIYDLGRGVSFTWERIKKDNGWGGYTVETEDYRDPVKHCEVYKKQGCSHVDGVGCNMNNCLIRKQK